jgi:hypothetical protein
MVKKWAVRVADGWLCTVPYNVHPLWNSRIPQWMYVIKHNLSRNRHFYYINKICMYSSGIEPATKRLKVLYNIPTTLRGPLLSLTLYICMLWYAYL